MAEDKRISELSPIPTVTPGALFPVVDEITGETMHARFDQMASTVDLDDYALKTYVDAQDIATLDDAKDYADLQDVTNLNAAKAYADGLVVGLWDDRGNFNASVNAYPSTGGSGTAGAIKKGDIWTVSVAGILPSSQSVEVGDTVRALVDTPGNTPANWSIQQNNIGYTAENSANKTNTVTGNETSTTLYASVKGFVDYLKGMTWLTGAIFGTWGQTLTADTNPVDADTIVVNDSVNSFEAKKTTLLQLWTNYIKGKADALFLTLTGGTLTGALNEASIVSVASATNVDIVNIPGNTALITGTTTIATFTAGTSGMIRRVQFASALVLQGGNNIRLPNNANTITTTQNDVATFVYSSTLSLWLCISYSSATPLTITRVPVFGSSGKLVNSQIFDNGASIFANTANYKSFIANGRIVSNSNDNFSFQVGNESTNAFFYGIGSGNTGVLRTVTNIIMSLNDNGVAIGSATINARSQLHLQATNKGFLPNVLTTAQRDAVSWVAGDAGMIIYNSTTNKHQGWNGTTWNDMY